MRGFFYNYFYLITFCLSFLLFWIFGDVIFFLVILAVIGEFILLKMLYRIRFYIIDVIIFTIYLIFAIITLLFAFSITFKFFLIVIGVWLCFTIFFHKRY